jgi:hypothetical protein
MKPLPAKRDLTLSYRTSLIVAALMAFASAGGLLLGSGGLYGPHPTHSLGVTEAEAGLLLPGFLGQDAFSLFVGLPLLLGSLWLARRGSLIGVLFWPGMLFYALYWYVLYLTGAPFSVLLLSASSAGLPKVASALQCSSCPSCSGPRRRCTVR